MGNSPQTNPKPTLRRPGDDQLAMGAIPVRDDVQDFHDAADRLGTAAIVGEDPNDPEYTHHLQTILAGRELAKLNYEKEHPWGSAENHPGTLGKIGHVMGVIGQVAGSAFAPRVMAAIPGTYLNRGLRERADVAQLNKGEQEQLAEQKETAAEGLGKENADTRLAQAEADQTKAAADLDKASAQPKAAADKGMWVNDASGKPTYLPESKVLAAAPGEYAPFEKPSTAQTPHDAFHEWLTDPQDYEKFQRGMAALKQSGRQLTPIEGAMLVRSLLAHGYADNPALLQSASDIAKASGLPFSPEDLQSMSGTPPGWQFDPVTGKPLGTQSPEFAKGQTVQRKQWSQEIIPTVDETVKQIGADPGLFGAVKGRVNEIMSGKIGSPNSPYYSALTNLHNIATAWMRVHANSDKAREDFINLLSTAQSPENLAAALGSIRQQLEIYANYGGKPGAAKESTKTTAAGGAGAGAKESAINDILKKAGIK